MGAPWQVLFSPRLNLLREEINTERAIPGEKSLEEAGADLEAVGSCL